MTKRWFAKRRKRSADLELLVLFVGSILFASFVLAVAPSWGTSSTFNYTTDEGTFQFHNLSLNITGYDGQVTFAFDTEGTFYWTNSSGRNSVSLSEINSWIGIYNESHGNLTINASFENQTGFFELPIQATNTTDSEFSGTIFEFHINATNDEPAFTSSQVEFNWSQGSYSEYTINVTDEELH